MESKRKIPSGKHQAHARNSLDQSPNCTGLPRWGNSHLYFSISSLHIPLKIIHVCSLVCVDMYWEEDDTLCRGYSCSHRWQVWWSYWAGWQNQRSFFFFALFVILNFVFLFGPCQLTEDWGEVLFSALKRAGGTAFSNMAVGYNNVDVSAANKYGVAVGNTPVSYTYEDH